MNPTKKIIWSLRLLFLGLILAVSSSEILAGYKVVLKDGRVLEARAKPVSMEGHYRFTDSHSQFQSIPIQLVDLTATQSLNAREEPKSTPARVLTNEDLSAKTPSTVNNSGGSSGSAAECAERLCLRIGSQIFFLRKPQSRKGRALPGRLKACQSAGEASANQREPEAPARDSATSPRLRFGLTDCTKCTNSREGQSPSANLAAEPKPSCRCSRRRVTISPAISNAA